MRIHFPNYVVKCLAFVCCFKHQMHKQEVLRAAKWIIEQKDVAEQVKLDKRKKISGGVWGGPFCCKYIPDCIIEFSSDEALFKL